MSCIIRLNTNFPRKIGINWENRDFHDIGPTADIVGFCSWICFCRLNRDFIVKRAFLLFRFRFYPKNAVLTKLYRFRQIILNFTDKTDIYWIDRPLRLWFKFVFKKRFNQLILIFTVKWILRNQKSSKSLNSRSTRSSFLMSRVLLQWITSFLSEWTIEWLLQVSLATSPRFHTLKRCDLPCFRSIPNFQLSIIHLWIDNNL